MRMPKFKSSTRTMSRKAPAQAWWFQFSDGPVAYFQMYGGSVGVKSLSEYGQSLLKPAVRSNGAVSPAMRAIDRKIAVMMAGSAAGTVTLRMVWACDEPRA